MTNDSDALGSSHQVDAPPVSVAVLVEIDDTWGRNVVEAIAHFARDHRWQLLLAPRDAERRLRVPLDWRGDGVVVSLRDPSLVEHVRGLSLPAVDVAYMYPEERWLGRVATDDVARAELAFDHFRTRRLQHFACFAPPIGRYPKQRADQFRKIVETAGFECFEFESNKSGSQALNRDALAAWLSGLPHPLGVFTADPYPARQLAEICVQRGFDVPGEIAILSGDEDELLCDIMSPQISSIELASHRIGFEAASMLESIMGTGEVPAEPLLVKPLQVCARRSTDYLAVNDPDLRRVARLIWDRAADGLQVSDLLETAAMSRRKMEQLFRDTLGRTPAEEIRRVKLEKARQLMVTTALSVEAIALTCGFSSGPYLAHAFRKQFGISPSELRVGRKACQIDSPNESQRASTTDAANT